MKRLNKKTIVEILFNNAEFHHIPVSEYDKTEECFFNDGECWDALNWVPKRLLKKAMKHGIRFVSNEHTYTGSRTDKYCDLDIRDAATGELIACPITTYDHDLQEEIKKRWGDAW